MIYIPDQPREKYKSKKAGRGFWHAFQIGDEAIDASID
jgi:hypothetical protein